MRDGRALRLGPVFHTLVPLAPDSITVQHYAALIIQPNPKKLIYQIEN